MRTMHRIGLSSALVMAAMLFGVESGYCDELLLAKAPVPCKTVNKPVLVPRAGLCDLELDVRIPDYRSEYKAGDELHLQVKANRDCYVYLVSIGSDGERGVLFPNRWDAGNRLRSGAVRAIPGDETAVRFRVKGPKGTDVVRAIATLEPLVTVESKSGLTSDHNVQHAGLTFEELNRALANRHPGSWVEKELSLRVVR